MVIQAAISYLTKIFSQGIVTNTIAVCSALTLTLSLQITRAFTSFNDRVNFDDFSLLVVTWGIFFFLHVIFTLLNFGTGLMASKHEHSKKRNAPKSHIDRDKLQYALWKWLGIVFLTILVAFFAIISSAVDIRTIFWTTYAGLCSIWGLACSYEFYSMGVNLERRFGSKPMIFSFWDRVTKSFEKKIIKKIEETSIPSSDDSGDSFIP